MIEKLRVELVEKSKKLEVAEAEIRRLKELPKKPKLKASRLDAPPADKSTNKEKKKRGGSSKRHKKSAIL